MGVGVGGWAFLMRVHARLCVCTCARGWIKWDRICAKGLHKRTPLPDSQTAAMLGYPTWAAYVQETLMAHNPGRVAQFLGDLQGRIAQARRSVAGVWGAMV